MTIDPILAAPLLVQVHIAAAVPALLLGPVALFRRRRDRLHRIVGRAWVIAILALALTGLILPGRFAVVGPFGPIHLFAPLAIWGVVDGVRLIRRGDVAGHRRAMRSVWFGAVGVASLVTLLPGRTLNRALFGEATEVAWIVIALGLVALVALWRRSLRGGSGGQITS
ncbi:MAG: putative membrane protein [Rhodobacteraceae bacterium HLUCCA08]|nr:MAG: putative membrane protein [Rhodobacteraceae bacterium HLUCCA08]